MGSAGAASRVPAGAAGRGALASGRGERRHGQGIHDTCWSRYPAGDLEARRRQTRRSTASAACARFAWASSLRRWGLGGGAGLQGRRGGRGLLDGGGLQLYDGIGLGDAMRRKSRNVAHTPVRAECRVSACGDKLQLFKRCSQLHAVPSCVLSGVHSSLVNFTHHTIRGF